MAKKRVLLGFVLLVLPLLLSSRIQCCRTTDVHFLDPLRSGNAKWINLAPTGFDPGAGQYPSEEEIRGNLEQLYEEGFDGVVTYDVASTLGSIPRLAKQAGFSVVGAGIWDILDEEAIEKAVSLKPYVDFYVVGSEGLFDPGRPNAYTADELKSALQDVRSRTCKPVTTAEPWNTFLDHVDLVHHVDFVCVNVYGWWQGEHDPVEAAEVTADIYDTVITSVMMERAAAGEGAIPVIVRETGFPTAEHPDATTTKQHLYFAALSQMDVPFVHFEAYDQFWKTELDGGYNIGPHWGLHEANGTLKVGTPAVAFTHVPPLGSFEDLSGVVVNVDSATHRVVVYIKVAGQYWVKPTYANPLTQIQQNGSWTAYITTGGQDQDASEIHACVVSAGYVPPGNTLPSNGDTLACASIVRAR